MVLHPRRAEHDHTIRRGVHSREEDKLVREARAPGADFGNTWDHPMEETGQSEHGRELHQPTDPALPEEGTSWLEYQGSADPTRTRQEALDKIEVRARIGELFNLADPNYVRLSDIEHTFKLARPPPKVTHLALYP